MVFCAPGTLAVPERKAGFDGYSLVGTRNIFDPERIPGVTSAVPIISQAPTTGADFAAFTGTLLTADKTLAFFSGSRPEYNTVLAVGGTIAGATLRQITAGSIEVEREGKRVTVGVGQTVPLNASSVPGIAPTPSAATYSSTPSFTTASSPTSTVSSGTAASASGSDRESLLRRMMEKRQQELK